MLKSVVHFVAKIILGIVVYLLLVIEGVFSVLETVFSMVYSAVIKLPNGLIAFLLCLASVLTVAFFLGEAMLSGVWLTQVIVVMWILTGVACWAIGILGSLAGVVVEVIFGFLNPGVPAGWLSSVAKKLADKYLNLEKGEAEPWKSIITFPYLAAEYIAIVLEFVAKVTVCIGTPLFFAWFGYRGILESEGFVEQGSADWWFCVVFAALCGLLGLYLGVAASQAVGLNEE